MIKDKFLSGNHRSATLGKVLRLLEELKKNPTGKVIYEHVEHMLEDYEDDRNTIENAYAGLLNILLESYAKNAASDPNLLAQVRSTQLRLNPPLSLSACFVLQGFLKQLAEQPPQGTEGQRNFQEAFTPLLQAFGFTGTTQATETILQPPTQTVKAPQNDILELDTSTPDELGPPVREDAEFQVETTYQYQLKKKREEFDSINERFARQIKAAIQKSDAFTHVLANELTAFKDAETIQDLEQRRTTMMKELETLLSDYRSLTREFDDISDILHNIEMGSRELNKELNRVRLLSLTDELTNLPNRRAFLKRVEEEQGRAGRYNIPLALVIIDLDNFKTINDTHGHRIGDMILKIYARDVLSIISHHDMVARYGGEEFAVILPNTTTEGSLCALRKVQLRASKIIWRIGDQRYALPTFSAGLAEYVPGETASELIDRADKAMYKAKHGGRNTIEVATAFNDTGSTPTQTHQAK